MLLLRSGCRLGITLGVLSSLAMAAGRVFEAGEASEPIELGSDSPETACSSNHAASAWCEAPVEDFVRPLLLALVVSDFI